MGVDSAGTVPVGRSADGGALVLKAKGNRIEGEVFAFNALRCNNSHALVRYSGYQFCDKIFTPCM